MRRGTVEGTERRTVSRRRFLRGAAAAGLLGVAAPAGAQEGTPTTASRTTAYELGAQVSAWVGQAPDAVADEENPTLRLVAGRTYAITWVNLDGQQHQLQVLDGSGEAVAESDVVATQGATGAVEFEASPAVATYRCSIHTSDMRGRIEVERPGTATTAGTETSTATGTAAGDGTEAATAAPEDAAATTDAVATTIAEGEETFGAGGASSRAQPGFGPLAGLAGIAGLLGLRRVVRGDD